MDKFVSTKQKTKKKKLDENITNKQKFHKIELEDNYFDE